MITLTSPEFKSKDKTREKLAFLGELHQDTHLIECNKLRWNEHDWNDLFKDIL